MQKAGVIRIKNFVFNITFAKYALLFVLLLFLCHMFPYSGDDWAWGSSIGIERLENWFDNYSGRYFGNLIVLALTRSLILRTIVMAVCLTGIIACIEYITENKFSFLLSIALLALMPRTVFRQSIAWTAGFSNYAMSIFLTLLFICTLKKILNSNTKKEDLTHSVLLAILLFSLGAANTLIVEHLTIYNSAVSVIIIGFIAIRCRKVPVQYIAYAAGSICGAIYMFSNSVYHSISSGADTYRSVGGTGYIKQALDNFFGMVYTEGYLNNLALNLCLLAICIFVYIKFRQTTSRKRGAAMTVCLTYWIMFVTWEIMSLLSFGQTTKSSWLIYLEGIGTALAVFSMIIFLITVSWATSSRWKILFFVGSTVLIILPLFVVTPIGSRCFFASYVLLVLICSEMLNLVRMPEGSLAKITSHLLATICIAAYAFYLVIFIPIHIADIDRINYVEEQISEGTKNIEIFHLPNESYIWMPTPGSGNATGELWIDRYKLFYELPEDTNLIVTDKTRFD